MHYFLPVFCTRRSDALRLFQALAVRLREGSAFSRTVGNEKLQRTVSECNVELLMLRFFGPKGKVD